MSRWSVMSLVFVATAFLGLGAREASALICCSVCDDDPNNPACRHGCSPSCRVDEASTAPDEVVYDDEQKVCYTVPASDLRLDAAAPACN